MDSKFQPKPAMLRRPKKMAHVLSALSLGLGFALIDRANDMLMDYLFPRENLIEFAENIKKSQMIANSNKENPTTEAKTQSATKKSNTQTQQIKFKREEFLNKVQSKAADIQDPSDQKTRALNEIKRRQEIQIKQRFWMNFFYGLVIAKLGSEINLNIISKKVPRLIPRLLITTPASILSYYTFANFYEGKDVEELTNRLRGDFLPLLSFRIIIEYPSNILLRRGANAKAKAITQEEVTNKIARNRIVSVGLWITLLTHLYQYSPIH